MNVFARSWLWLCSFKAQETRELEESYKELAIRNVPPMEDAPPYHPSTPQPPMPVLPVLPPVPATAPPTVARRATLHLKPKHHH